MQKTDKKEILVFQLNEEMEDFEKFDVPADKELHEILNSAKVLLILDPPKKLGWRFLGSKITSRMKFLSAQLALNVRDDHGLAMEIRTVEEGSSSSLFKYTVGLIDEFKPKII